VDDVNNMDESMDPVEQPLVGLEKALRAGVDRRTMLKAAVATGTIAATWVAPRIQTLGFAPAAAAGTPCIILSPASEDENSNSGKNDCKVGSSYPPPCCGVNFGNNGGSPDRWTFNNPVTGCTQIVVRSIGLDCNAALVDPDAGQFAVIIESFSETTSGACAKCKIMDAVLVDSSNRAIQLPPLDNGPVQCGPPGLIGSGVNASVSPCSRVLSSSRLAVRLSCIGGTAGCTPP